MLPHIYSDNHGWNNYTEHTNIGDYEQHTCENK